MYKMAEFLSHSHTAVTQKPFTYQAHRMFHIRAFCFRSLVTLGVRFLFVQLLQFFLVCVCDALFRHVCRLSSGFCLVVVAIRYAIGCSESERASARIKDAFLLCDPMSSM